MIVGAGDIAVYLVRLAHAVGMHTVVIDPRAAFLTRERFPDADELIEGWPDEVADRAGINETANVVALAHDPKIDDPVLVSALRRGSLYVGALGSRRSTCQRVARLREAGLDDAESAAYTPRSGSTSAVTRRPTSRSGSWPRSWQPACGAPNAVPAARPLSIS